MTATVIGIAKKRRNMHVHLDAEHDVKLRAISKKLWEIQKRGGEPTAIEGIRHAIILAHGVMFPKS